MKLSEDNNDEFMFKDEMNTPTQKESNFNSSISMNEEKRRQLL